MCATKRDSIDEGKSMSSNGWNLKEINYYYYLSRRRPLRSSSSSTCLLSVVVAKQPIIPICEIVSDTRNVTGTLLSESFHVKKWMFIS